jgi:hypothetical protein
MVGNKLYDKARNLFLRGDLSWKFGAANWRAILVDIQGGAGYTFNQAADDTLAAIPAQARVAEVALSPADPVAGVADAQGVTFLAVTGAVSEAIVICNGVGDAAKLVAYIDTATGLPVTPNGGDINVVWDAVNKIFKL